MLVWVTLGWVCCVVLLGKANEEAVLPGIDSFFFKKKAGVPKKIKLCPTISLDPLC
jgi:hypothetical protein